ncbi:MAG: lamin tail domain-containing protein [Candidatus Hodarchaeota archaeon]
MKKEIISLAMLTALLLSTLAFFSPLATSKGETAGTAVEKADHVVINEILYDDSEDYGDFVELYNPTSSAVDISDWYIGTAPSFDAINGTSYEGGYRFPASGVTIGAEEALVIASNGTEFYDQYNVVPDYEFNDTSATIPDMVRWDTDDSETFASVCYHGGDDLWLNNSAGDYVDGLGWESPSRAVEGDVAAEAGPGQSLERYIAWLDTDDNSKDFRVTDPPTPGQVTLRPSLVFMSFTISASEVAQGINVTVNLQIWDIAFSMAAENATVEVTIASFLAGSATRNIAMTAVNATNATYTGTIDTSIMAGSYRVVATAKQPGYNNVTETLELAIIGADTFIVLMVSDTDTHGIYAPYGAANTGQWQAVFKNRTNTIVRFHTTGRFNASTFADVDFFIMPITPGPRGTAPARDEPLDTKNITNAEAAVIKSFVDNGGRMLLCGYYERGYWMWNSTNRIAEQWGVSYVVPDPLEYSYSDLTNYTQFYDEISNYGDRDYQTKITDFVDHPITRGVTEWYLKGGHINVTGSDAKVLSTASEDATYQIDTDTWINGTDINVMALYENANGNGGSVIFTYAYILREDYTLSHGKENNYDGMKLINNVVTWVTDVSAPLFEYGVIPDDIHPPADITYEEGSLGNIITWNPFDDNPATYTIYKNGTSVDSDDWDGLGITIAIDGLAIGVYNYTCVVVDINDRMAVDTVLVTVVKELPKSSEEEEDSPGLTAGIVFLAMVPVAIAVIRRRRRT